MKRRAGSLFRVSGWLGLVLLLLSSGCRGGDEAPASPAVPTPSPSASPGATITPPETSVPPEHPSVRVEGSGVIVDSVGDSNERDGAVTLREAIMLATGKLAAAELGAGEINNVNGNPGPESADTIIFEPLILGAETPATIFLTDSLLSLDSGDDVVDGSQAGVIVDGGNQGFDCLRIDSSRNAIRGLQIQDCATAITVAEAATDNTIGGSAEGQGNVISSNDAVGIRVNGSANVIQGNYIGTDASGTVARPNRMEGIWIAQGAQDNLIGGVDPGQGNIISNNLFGVYINGPEASDNAVKGNLIGVDISGRVSLKNRYGVVVDNGAQNNIIGGSDRGEANVISGNQDGGVLIRNPGTSDNLIMGNFIGTNSSGSERLGNATGIWLRDSAQGNTIGGPKDGEGNVIANNGFAGILIEGADTTGNTIRGNSIHSGGRDAIVSKDDGGLGLAPPTITAADPVSGTACPRCIVDVYSDQEGEGGTYEGTTTADVDGRFAFQGTPSGRYVTATVTDEEGSTSLFSEPFRMPGG